MHGNFDGAEMKKKGDKIPPSPRSKESAESFNLLRRISESDSNTTEMEIDRIPQLKTKAYSLGYHKEKKGILEDTILDYYTKETYIGTLKRSIEIKRLSLENKENMLDNNGIDNNKIKSEIDNENKIINHLEENLRQEIVSYLPGDPDHIQKLKYELNNTNKHIARIQRDLPQRDEMQKQNMETYDIAYKQGREKARREILSQLPRPNRTMETSSELSENASPAEKTQSNDATDQTTAITQRYAYTAYNIGYYSTLLSAKGNSEYQYKKDKFVKDEKNLRLLLGNMGKENKGINKIYTMNFTEGQFYAQNKLEEEIGQKKLSTIERADATWDHWHQIGRFGAFSDLDRRALLLLQTRKTVQDHCERQRPISKKGEGNLPLKGATTAGDYQIQIEHLRSQAKDLGLPENDFEKNVKKWTEFHSTDRPSEEEREENFQFHLEITAYDAGKVSLQLDKEKKAMHKQLNIKGKTNKTEGLPENTQNKMGKYEIVEEGLTRLTKKFEEAVTKNLQRDKRGAIAYNVPGYTIDDRRYMEAESRYTTIATRQEQARLPFLHKRSLGKAKREKDQRRMSFLDRKTLSEKKYLQSANRIWQEWYHKGERAKSSIVTDGENFQIIRLTLRESARQIGRIEGNLRGIEREKHDMYNSMVAQAERQRIYEMEQLNQPGANLTPAERKSKEQEIQKKYDEEVQEAEEIHKKDIAKEERNEAKNRADLEKELKNQQKIIDEAMTMGIPKEIIDQEKQTWQDFGGTFASRGSFIKMDLDRHALYINAFNAGRGYTDAKETFEASVRSEYSSRYQEDLDNYTVPLTTNTQQREPPSRVPTSPLTDSDNLRRFLPDV